MIIFVFLGIIASIFQLVILREFTFSIAKHELSFVISVGIWLISSSIGSLFANKTKRRNLDTAIILSLIFSLSVSAIHLIKSLFHLRYYESVSLGFALFAGIILISPTAFIIGYSFSNFVQKVLEKKSGRENLLAKFFAFEAIGFFLGSVSFVFFLSRYSNPFILSILPLLLIVNIKRLKRKLFSCLAILFISIVFLTSYNQILKKEFQVGEILKNIGSSYGPLILTKTKQVESLFASGSLLATSEDKVSQEEFIHMSLSATKIKTKKDILFIGACFPGQIQELLKHNIRTLDCVDLNSVISSFVKNRLPPKVSKNINFITDDPRVYLKRKGKLYDCILMSIPAPSNLALNRYYSTEFFQLVKSNLNKEGIFSFYIPSKRDILSPRILRFNSSIVNSLDAVFPDKLLIPSDTMIIIATDRKELRASELIENFSKTNLKTQFFTIYHLKDYLEPDRQAYLEKMLDKKISANLDLAPFGFLSYLALEQAKFYPRITPDFKKIKQLIIILFSLALISLSVIVLRKNKSSRLINMALVGFISISFNSIIFMLFQLYSGALFWKAGLLMGSFMIGLSSGTFFVTSLLYNQKTKKISLEIIFLFWLLLILSLWLGLGTIANSVGVDYLFYLYSVLGGVFTGAAYPLLARDLLKNNFIVQHIPGSLYAADLSGAFIGSIISGLFLLPFLGISEGLIVLMAVCAAFSLANFFN